MIGARIMLTVIGAIVASAPAHGGMTVSTGAAIQNTNCPDGDCTPSTQLTDSKTKGLLVGLWTIDTTDTGNEIEREAIALGIFGMSLYRADGSGVTDVYRGALCGKLVRHHPFRWNVMNGILITEGDDKVSQARVINITSTRYVLQDIATGARENRLRVGNSKCSPSS